MRTLLFALLAGIVGYVAGVAAGIAGVSLFSSNQHDRSLEATMTGFFFFGPICAVGAVILFLVLRALR